MQTSRHPQINMLALSARIQPQSGELAKAQSHLMTVRRRLAMSFDISKFLRIGSHARGTAIRWYSDVDVLAVLRRNEAKWGGSVVNSSTFLKRVRRDLEDRYTATEVRGDQQAVVAHFGGGEHALDVVPAIFHKWDKGRPVYLIPDGYDSWVETSPETHNAYFAGAAERSGQKLRKVVQLLKWWKYSRSQPIPVEAFHIDILLAANDVCSGVKSYGQCLVDAFQLLAERECRGFRDPLGISGVVYAAKTDAQWRELREHVNFALVHAKRALAAESWKDFAESNRQWNLVFNGEY
jgi:hypothetical protein